jgi:polysaccharide export outer membrane protein
LKPFVKDAAVNVQILNFKINVMGDVQSPGMFPIQNERITVLDALALAGDTNISGERIVEIKRETEKGVITGYIDLKSNKLFASPYFYLQQNDVVYVNPNKAKIQSASSNSNTSLFVSITGLLITIVSLLTR